ncbi:hypothetical protein DFAR_910006 [Desulfarculales bacterium]
MEAPLKLAQFYSKFQGLCLLAERVGFEPTCRVLADNPISSRARYDHFGTSPNYLLKKAVPVF